MSNATRYGLWLRIIHWLTALLVIGALTTIELKGYAERGSSLRDNLMFAHIQFGLAVLLLFLPHLLVRLRNTAPPIVPPMPKWQVLLSRLVHLSLFVLLIAQPLLGLLGVQASGHAVGFLGISIPMLVAQNKDLGHSIIEIHETAGNVMLWLAIAHAVAALWHHWGARDNTLRRMGFRRD